MKLRLDGWGNLLSKVGIRGRDKRLSSCPEPPSVLNQQDLENLYHGNDIAHKIVRTPARDMTRKGIDLNIENGDSLPVLQAMETMRAMAKFAEALTWGRLFGGAIMFIGADDGQDPAMPLNMEGIRSIRFITVLDRHDVHIRTFFSNPLLPEFGQPETYEVIRSQEDTLGQGDRVGNRRAIHSSRVIRIDGTLTTRRRRRNRKGWSDSVFVRMFDVLRGYGGTWDTVEVLMADFAQAVFKMKDLGEMMGTHGEDQVMKRLELMDTSRSVLRGILIDAEMEDFERKATPLAGLPEVLREWKARMASAAEMPVTLLFGTSAEGMNATGEGDQSNWFETVAGMQEELLRPGMERFLEILFNTQDGPTNGTEPEVWSFSFPSLEELNDTEEAQIRKITAETDQIYIQNEVVSASEIAESRFGGEKFNTETVLDRETRDLMASIERERMENPPETNNVQTDPSGSTSDDNGDVL